MDREGIDLKGYWNIFLRRWWVFLIGALIGPLLIQFTTSGPLPTYRTTASVLVESRSAPGLPSSGDLSLSRQLADSYSDLVKTRPVLQRVVDELALPYGPSGLASKLEVQNPRSILFVRATDTDPELAAQIANTTARLFIEHQRDRQLTQIAQFQSSLNQYGIAQDSGALAAQVASVTHMSLLEEATPPSAPINQSKKTRNMVFALLGGVVVAAVVAGFLEQMDDTIKSPDEAKELTGVTPLGIVPKYRTSRDRRPALLREEDQQSALGEAYKFVRTNLGFIAMKGKETKVVLVTSSVPSEGKTTTATNLAIAIAREGKRVFLVDADLRKPSLHRVFDVDGNKGLTSVLYGRNTLEEALQATGVAGLRVLPAGPLPPDPTVILRSPAMQGLVEQLRASSDMLIFDSPPLLVVTDPMLVAPFMDGVIMVVDLAQVRRHTVRRAAEILAQANVPVSGMVINKVSTRGRGSRYYYEHYYYYRRGYHYYSSNGSGRKALDHVPVIGRLLHKQRPPAVSETAPGSRTEVPESPPRRG